MTLTDHCPNLVTETYEGLGVYASAVFSEDARYRYALVRLWDPDQPLTVWIMCNPSTADAVKDDPTIRRCTSFARAWGSGGILVVNLFAYRSPNPRILRTQPDPIGPDNDAVIAWHLGDDHERVGPVVAAWGVHGTHLNRGAYVTELIAMHGKKLLCLGVTKNGHPKHPLYIPNHTQAVDYATAVEAMAS